MRRIALLVIGALLMIAAPVFSQASTPVAPITTPIVRDITEATQTLGTLTVVVLIVCFVLALIVVFFVIGALRLAVPLITTVQKLMADLSEERQGRRKAEEGIDETRKQADQEVAQLRQQQAKHLSETAGAMLRLGNIMSETESKKEAEAGRAGAVSLINAHVTDDGDKTRVALKEVVEKVGEVKQVVDKAATVDSLNAALAPIQAKMDEMSEMLAQVVRRRGTDELKPPADPPTSSSSSPGSPS